MNKTIIALAIASAASTANANDNEVSAFFINAMNSSLTFKALTAKDDIGKALVHYTSRGRTGLINELERTGIARQAAEKNGSLTTSVKRDAMQIRQAPGYGDSPTYEVVSSLGLQWFNCINVTCVPAGEMKFARVSGTVVVIQENGRPAYKVDTINLDGGMK